MKRERITKRQKELLFILYEYIKEEGYPPTFQEMKDRLNVYSNQSIIDLLEKLKNNNFIKRNNSAARGISILPLGYKVLGKPSLVAFLGVTSAGAPIEAVEIPGEWEEVSHDLSKFKNDVFLLKISGDSMINAGIDDNDVVLVKSQKEFVSGDVVLAQIRDESTIKRFISDDKPPFVYLKPENPKYDNIVFNEEMEMKGKVISVLKNGYWKSIK
ncbi:MAG: transcriptional repressor LexA [Candidatus Nealsonbacteria bacterium]